MSANKTTAEALAAHPRWELRGGMLVLDTRCHEWMRCGDAWAAARANCGEPGWSSYVPDLADDATAGVVLGMVREWARARHGAAMVTTSDLPPDVFVGVDCRSDGAHAHAYGPTLGEAAGRCLLACWEYDAEEGK